jgi:hypothetical protein
MIVECNKKRYLVITMCLYEHTNLEHRKNDMLCLGIDDDKTEWINLSDVSIIDGRLPFGMCINRQKTEESERNESYLCIEYDCFFRNEGFWNKVDDEDPSTMLCYYGYINAIKALHDLPLTDTSKWKRKLEEEIKQNKVKTSEEERLDAIDTQLEEYLRVGEAIMKDSNGSKNG